MPAMPSPRSTLLVMPLTVGAHRVRIGSRHPVDNIKGWLSAPRSRCSDGDAAGASGAVRGRGIHPCYFPTSVGDMFSGPVEFFSFDFRDCVARDFFWRLDAKSGYHDFIQVDLPASRRRLFPFVRVQLSSLV